MRIISRAIVFLTLVVLGASLYVWLWAHGTVDAAIVLPKDEVSFEQSCHCWYGRSQRRALTELIQDVGAH